VSDLQCPARILLVRSGVEAVVLAGLVARENVVRTITANAPVDLDALADLHRGETVLVVSDVGPHVDSGRDVLLVEIDADGRHVSDVRLG
jgi:hypothetical protein